MKKMILTALVVLGAYGTAFGGQAFKIETLNTANECDPNPGQCKIKDQSGSIEPWECRNSSTGNIRCYADVEYENGTKLRIWGGCYDSFSDCWSTGDGAVEPCDQ